MENVRWWITTNDQPTGAEKTMYVLDSKVEKEVQYMASVIETVQMTRDGRVYSSSYKKILSKLIV